MRRIVVITDEELAAYLDDAIDPVRRREIDAALAHDQRLAERLAGLDIDLSELRAGFDALADSAPVDRLRARLASAGRTERPPARSARWFAIAAALMIAAAFGYVVGSRGIGARVPGWQSAIADYQALYTGATLASLVIDPAIQRRDVAEVSARLGLPLELEALQIPGLDYKRAQILSFEGRPLAQFAYLDQTGTPIAFCATPTGEADSPIRAGTFRGLDAAFWSHKGFGFIVIGGTRADQLEQAATLLAQRI